MRFKIRKHVMQAKQCITKLIDLCRTQNKASGNPKHTFTADKVKYSIYDPNGIHYSKLPRSRTNVCLRKYIYIFIYIHNLSIINFNWQNKQYVVRGVATSKHNAKRKGITVQIFTRAHGRFGIITMKWV